MNIDHLCISYSLILIHTLFRNRNLQVVYIIIECIAQRLLLVKFDRFNFIGMND